MAATDRKFLVFEVQKVLYAFDLAQIAEVADPPRSWPIPLAPACFTGAMHVHGVIVAALDLALFLDLPKSQEPEKMILLHHSVAALAFLVGRIIRIVSENDITIQESSDLCFSTFTLLLPEGETYLLDVNKILKASENMMN